MNFKKLLIGAFALSAMLAACVDDSTSAKDTDQSDELVETFDDLPVCSDKREGATAYVKDEKNAYMCVDGDWVPEEENSSSSIASSSSSSRNDSLSSSVIASSSSEAKQSSSSEKTGKSSSSVDDASSRFEFGCKTETEDNCEYGELIDDRDGQTYKTVTIGTQTWMAENLNYEAANSYCYKDNASNCTKYGRLYTWAAATDSAGVWGENGKGCGYAKHCTTAYPVRGVCPEGWHLPTKNEWNTLSTAVGGQTTPGKVLKSTSGWYTDDVYHGNGTDAFSFSALPAGYRIYTGLYDLAGYYAYFWSSTARDSRNAYNVYLYYNHDYMALDYSDKRRGFSVRCVKD